MTDDATTVPPPATVECGDCGAPMVLRNSRFGKFYGCSTFPKCRGTHGAHADGSPKGIPADKETREARMAAHKVFDSIWKSGLMKRKDAYAMLRRELSIPANQCHIAMFDKDMCAMVLQIVEEYGEP